MTRSLPARTILRLSIYNMLVLIRKMREAVHGRSRVSIRDWAFRADSPPTLPLNIHLNPDALAGVMSRHVCEARVALSKTTALGAFLRLTAGLFSTSLCLQAVCRSILITIQIVIDLPSLGPVARGLTLPPWPLLKRQTQLVLLGLSARLLEGSGGHVSRAASMMDG